MKDGDRDLEHYAMSLDRRIQLEQGRIITVGGNNKRAADDVCPGLRERQGYAMVDSLSRAGHDGHGVSQLETIENHLLLRLAQLRLRGIPSAV